MAIIDCCLTVDSRYAGKFGGETERKIELNYKTCGDCDPCCLNKELSRELQSAKETSLTVCTCVCHCNNQLSHRLPSIFVPFEAVKQLVAVSVKYVKLWLEEEL